MKTSEEFILGIKEQSGDQMTRDGKLIRDMDDKELMKRMLERYPGERENIIDIDEYLGEEASNIPDVPAKSDVQAKLDAVSKSPSFLSRVGNRIKETAGDVVETAQGVGSSIADSAKDLYGIATNDDTNLAQKFAAGSGRVASGAAGIIGELTIGAGKTLLPQDGEDMVKSLTEKVGTAVSETEAAKTATEWYQNLSPDNKVIVDSLGGIASLVTEVIGLKGGSMAGKVIKKGIEESAQAVAPVAIKVAEEVGDVAVDGARKLDELISTSDATLEKRIQEQFQKGVKPTIRGKENLGQVEKYKSNASEAVNVITQNKDNLKFKDEVGETIQGRTPESLQEFSDAITQTKESIFKQYDTLAKEAGDKGLKVDPKGLTTELDAVINDRALQLSNPEAVKYAESVKERFGNAGELTAEEAQNVVKNYNNSLQAFYRNPTPEGLTRNAVDALMVNQIRKSLDEGIEGLTAGGYQDLKNQYGALRTIEKDVLNATLRDARKNTAGLIDFTDILTGGQLVTSLATLNPAGLAGAATQFGIKNFLKYLNNPNRQVQKMFKTSEKLQDKGKGYFEQAVTEPAVGMSIKNGVIPDKVAENLTIGEYRTIKEYLLNPADKTYYGKTMNLMEKIGIDKADEATQNRFLQEVVTEWDKLN